MQKMLTLVVAAALQVSPTPPPAPPGPARPGSRGFAYERANYEKSLREACLSERGVATAIEHWTRERAAMPDIARDRAPRQEVGEAALTPPIDLDRLEAALEGEAAAQHAFRRESIARSMAVMRALSPADRVIFARRLTIWQPAVWPQRCPSERASP
jgi:hypothetical protein